MTVLSRRAVKLVKSILARGGLEVHRPRSDFHWAPNYYGRSYGLREDIRDTPVFGDLARATIERGRSCLYYDRLYVLFQALTNLRRFAHDPGLVVAEVGVYRGGTTAFIASTAATLELPVTIHAFDTFEGHSASDVVHGIDTVHKPGDFADTSYDDVSSFLRTYPNVTTHRGRFQDTCGVLRDARLGLLHLDVDLYAPTLHALRFAHDRLVIGGICIIDDFDTSSCPGIRQAVDEFVSTQPGYFAIHPLTEQCVLVKVS